jgi:hypothetical protein
MTRGVIALLLAVPSAWFASVLAIAGGVDPAPELRLCATKSALMTALSRVSTQARAVPMQQRLALQLSPEKSVVLPGTSADLERERATVRGATYAGLVRLEAVRAGIYRVSVDRDAWLDLATAAGTLLDPAPDEGTFDCAGTQKVLLYRLPAPGTYWLQIALSPRSETFLTVIPPERGAAQ